MSLLTVSNIQHAFGPDMLFTGINFRLEWGQKVGLIGKNGAGKTTLMRILTDQMEPEKGKVNYWPGVRFGYLEQEQAVDPNRTVLQEAEAAFAPVMAMEANLRKLEHQIADVAEDPDKLAIALEEYGLMHDRFAAMGGYDNLRDIPAVLKQLGFGPQDIQKSCSKLSGGEKTRLALARLLLSGPDLLYLDEPTNHLDIEAIEWLEGFLQNYGGALLLISHDRTFLDRVTTSIAELDQKKITFYPGNYSAFLKQKEANREKQLEQYEREQKEIARLTEFFEKWKNTPTKKTQAYERMKWAEKIKEHGLTMRADAQAAERVAPTGRKMKGNIQTSKRSGDEVVILDGVGKQYGSRTLFSNVSGLIMRGDRLGIVGPNGVGKSTLVKILLGRETPTTGMVRLGASVTVGYFAQDTSDLDLDATVIENLMSVADMEPAQARMHLAKFLFTGEDVFRPARMLSGGEKNKLVLAQLTIQKPNLLVLDEPTNHLDIDSRETLNQMLIDYDGTLLLVSHDRYLLEIVTTRILEVDQGSARLLDMNYGEYREKMKEGSLPVWSAAQAIPIPKAIEETKVKKLLQEKPAVISISHMNAHQRSKERQRARQIAEAAELRVSKLEAKLSEIEASLSSPTPGLNMVALAQEHGAVQIALNEAVQSWQRAAEYEEAIAS